jgi:hypothetical protein
MVESPDSPERRDDPLVVASNQEGTLKPSSTAVMLQKALEETQKDYKDVILVSPSPLTLTKKWPSVLMRLMNEHNVDDEWRPVVDRIASHPHEIPITGRFGGQTALHAACVRYPPLHIVQALCAARPQVAIEANFSGETPLHLASYCASEEVACFLVQAAPAAAAMGDQYGDVPLHFCARQGATFGLMQLMLEAAPQAISARNRRSVTPFFVLPRSYLETESLEEICQQQEEEEEDYADDWNLMVLFLRFAYFGSSETAPRADTYTEKPCYDWLVAAAASTPSCPRDVLKFLCRMFPEQATQFNSDGYTPLLLACQAPELEEPEKWDETEDGYREPIEAAEGELQNPSDRVAPEELATSGDVEFLQNISASSSSSQGNNDKESVVEILLEWSPRSAFLVDAQQGRLPLAHALATGKSGRVIRHLIAACPEALDARTTDGWYMFQLAALNAPELDSVYTAVRTLPILLQMARQEAQQRAQEEEEPPRKKARIEP